MSVMCLLDLRLRATEAIVFPRAAAPVLHGAIHRLLERVDPEYGWHIHNQQLKPMALSPLTHALGRVVSGTAVSPGGRLGVLESTLLSVLVTALLACQQSGRELSLDGRGALIEGVRVAAGPITYRSLAAGAAPRAEITVRFVTPTIFRHKGETKPSPRGPEPRLLFGGYLRRWQAFAPPDLVTAVTDATISAQVSLRHGHCLPRRVDLGKFQQQAFTGWATYDIAGDARFRAEIATLAAYSAFCGTGARAAFGMGQTTVGGLASPLPAADPRKELSA